MFMRGSLRRGDLNDVIYDAEGTHDGPIWVHASAIMGSCEGRYGFTWGPI